MSFLVISDLLPGLEERAQEETAAGRFSGAVLVARGAERIFAGAYGLADRAKGIPNTLTTRFHNGSLTKMFTGVAVGQLIQAGLVEPVAPVAAYLPQYPNDELATKVNIHQLLTHSGGTGDIFVPEYLERREKVSTVADYVALFGSRPPRFEPGTRYEYSNYGFILLGAVIEAVSGQSYYDYLDEHVFAPAGMPRTGTLPEAPDLAVGYTRYDTEREEYLGDEHPNTDTLPHRASPAGCAYTTVEDLWRFERAITGHRLLDERHTTLVTTGRGTFGWDARRVCYGFFEEAMGGIRTFSHIGGAPGMSADFVVWPETGLFITVLANVDPPVAPEVSRFVLSLLPLPA